MSPTPTPPPRPDAALRRLRELCDAATPGPWAFERPGGVPRVYTLGSKDTHGRKSADGVCTGTSVANGEFIAAARSALPLLLDLAEEVEETARRLHQAYAYVRDSGEVTERGADVLLPLLTNGRLVAALARLEAQP